MSDQQMANRLYSIFKEKAAMGMGVSAGARKKSGSKTAKRSKSCPVRRNCPKGSRKMCKAGELEDIMEVFGRGSMKKGSKSAKKAARNNPWITFIKEYAAEQGMSYREALQSKRAHSAYCQAYGRPAKSKACKSGSKTAKKKVTFKKKVVSKSKTAKKKAVSKSKTAKKKCPKGTKAKMVQGYKRKSGKQIKPFRRCVAAGEFDEMLYY